MTTESIPEQLRAVAAGIEAGEFEVDEADELDFKVGEDRIAVKGEWVE